MQNVLKKVIAIVMVVIFCMSAGVVNVLAEELTKPTLQVESVSAMPGSTVKVKIDLKNNPGLASLKFNVNYDDVLTLTNVEFNSEFGTYVTAPTPYKNPQTISMISPLANVSVSGNFCILTFTVSNEAEDNYSAAVNIVYDADDIFNAAYEPVELNVENGGVKVYVGVPGDINGDKKVNNRDAILLFQYVAGWDVEVDLNAVDCNGDDKVNTKDAIDLFRYCAGWEGIELKRGAPCFHDLQATERVEPTCEKDGNIAYWHCTKCDKYYSNANATTIISVADTIIPAKGHTEVIDPAVPATETSTGLTEGSHCSECLKILVPQKEIPKLEVEQYAITYNVANGDEYIAGQIIENPNPNYYTSSGLNLKNISCPGYNFLGWYDLASGENAKNIKSIEAGKTGEIELYAHWEKINYNISFKSNLVNSDKMTYTVDECTILPVLKLAGYNFVGWSDNEGNVITSISEGTIGNKTYTANWLSERNKAWTKSKLDAPIIVEDEETNTILFTYEIGRIENVPLYTIEDFGYINSEGVSRTITKEYTVKTEKALMDQYSKNVANATTNSSQWSLSSGWSDSVSVSDRYLTENNISETDAKTLCTTDEKNWLISSGSSGSTTTTKYNSSQNYDLNTETGNTKTYNTRDDSTSKTHKQSAELTLGAKKTITAEADFGAANISAGVELNAELDVGYEGSRTKSTATKKGTESDKGKNTQKGSVKHTGADTVSTGGWNSSKSYGGSKSVSESNSVSKTVSKKIASELGYGRSYINTGGETSSQGVSTSSSNSDTYSSAVTYSTEETVKESITYSTSNTKTGYHRLVKAGFAHVFAVVGYDIATASYFVSTYTVMDDKTYNFEDYSYATAQYDDNQTGVISFEVPYEVNEYVLSKVGETEGLEFNSSGMVTNYYGNEKMVVIPEYHVVDNLDSTKTVIKITGISSNAFIRNTNITGIELSEFITEIPNNAFEGCSSLSLINMSGITSIGEKAFKDCPQIDFIFLSDNITHIGENAFKNSEYFIAYASNADVVYGMINSGAKNICIYISDKCEDLNEKKLYIGNSTELFVLNGRGKCLNDFCVNSDANKTVINNISLYSTRETPLKISSQEIQLGKVIINSPGIAFISTANNCNLNLYGENKIDSTIGKAVLGRNINVAKAEMAIKNGVHSELKVNGDILICGEMQGTSFVNCYGIINDEITETEYEKYLNGICKITFEPNGGTVSESERNVYFGSTIGNLPVPTRENYVFNGWYTEKDAGTRVNDDTVISKYEDCTLYAHWDEDTYLLTFDANGGSITETTRTAIRDKAIGDLPIPTRQYYTFNGWYTSAIDGEEVTADSIYNSETTIYAHWTVNSYSYNIVYKSSNGTSLGTSSVTNDYGTTHTISAPAKAGYSTPASQNVVWDSSSKTITFVYAPNSVSSSQTFKSGTWHAASQLKYSSTIEYRNRTSNSIEVRLKWTNTIGANHYYGYHQYVHIAYKNNSDSDYNSGVTIAENTKFANTSTSSRSSTVYTNWLTIPVSATQTSVTVYANYWSSNYKSGGANEYISKEVKIPAY